MWISRRLIERKSLHCPKCKCVNVVESYGIYICSCCGLVFDADDAVAMRKDPDE